MKNKGLVPSGSTPLTINVVEGFTLIEILVVITIITLLATVGISSYTTLTRQSFDSRRKADLEEVRAALEMYKSNNGVYPTAAEIVQGSIFEDASGKVYLQKVPKDPKSGTIEYDFSNIDSVTSTYTLGAYLENADSGFDTCGDCGVDVEKLCNYCLTPYGRQ